MSFTSQKLFDGHRVGIIHDETGTVLATVDSRQPQAEAMIAGYMTCAQSAAALGGIHGRGGKPSDFKLTQGEQYLLVVDSNGAPIASSGLLAHGDGGPDYAEKLLSAAERAYDLARTCAQAEAHHPAIGLLDQAGSGSGWHLVVYQNDEGQILLPECDNDDNIACFHKVKPKALLPLPDDHTLPDARIGDAAPLAFVLRDGQCFVGSEAEVLDKLHGVLVTEPDLIGPLTALQIAEMCGDMNALALVAEHAARFMGEMPGTSGSSWRKQQLMDAYRDAFVSAYPDVAGDRYRGAVRDLWVHIEDGNAWVALPTALWEASGTDGVACPVADALCQGFGLTMAGFVDGGERPHRWSPDDDQTPTRRM